MLVLFNAPLPREKKRKVEEEEYLYFLLLVELLPLSKWLLRLQHFVILLHLF